MKTYRQVFDKILSMAPANWFYYINERGVVYFKIKPTTPTHKFVFGKHFTDIKIFKSMEKTRNSLLIWNGVTVAGICRLYTDDASINKYGRRVTKLFDYGLNDTDTADKIGNKFVEENKDIEIKVVCKIIDNNLNSNRGYDIESISPGDTCSFFGFDDSLATLFKENMLISKVYYTLNEVTLTVEVKKSSLVEWQRILDNNIDDKSTENATTDYTAV